ncbi:MAG: hypothetical protein IJD51_03070 [Clostridia bacterium]|nr:hypothetical protein [Clostridia bacterium]
MRIKLHLPLSLSEIARATHSHSSPEDKVITHISTDTRELMCGDLFIALRGERFDGEDYVEPALQIGAYTLAQAVGATVRVESVAEALVHLIRHYIKKLPSLKYTVGITGSVGKTTTKELLRALVEEKYRTHATDGNLNNLYGVLFTTLCAPKDTEVLIFELGMNHTGEIRNLSAAISPDVAIITNIGTAHIGNLGSKEKIAEAKLEICATNTKICIIPYGEPLLKSAPHPFTYSSDSPNADAYFISLRSGKSGTVFDLYSRGSAWLGKHLPLVGTAAFNCFCAALSAALYMGLGERELDSRLPILNEAPLRQKFINVGKYTIYDDTYSASYEATVGALDMLRLYNKPTHAVLFDMLELGEDSARLHRLAGRRCAECGISHLFTVGSYADEYAIGARSGGMKSENIHINKDTNDLSATLEAIKAHVADGILLVKGSHATQAERIIEMIRKETT